VAALFWLAPLGASAAPKITVPTLRYEIGTLTAGETAEAEFPLTNTGTDLLKIEEVKTSCGCTTASYPQTLQPGEKGVLKVKLVSQPLWSGVEEKHLIVRCNNRNQPQVELDLTAQMRPLFRFSPANPVAVPYRKGELLRQVITVTAASDRDVRITGVTPAGPETGAQLLPAESAGSARAWRVEITARPPEAGGDFSRTVTLQTSDPKVPAIPLVVTGLAQDALAVLPPILYLGRLSAAADTGPPPVLTIYRRAGAFRVVEVKTDSPALKTEIGPLDAPDAAGHNSFYGISVHYLGGWKKGKVPGKIVVRIDDPAVPKLEVPYEATVD